MSNYNFPPISNHKIFEDLILDIAKKEFQDLSASKNARPGQKQQGVDIYGYPHYLKQINGIAGIQCKSGKINKLLLEDEIKSASNFNPPLAEYIIATACSRDAKLQEDIRELNLKKEWKFKIILWFWEDIVDRFSDDQKILEKYYPLPKSMPTTQSIREKIMASKVADWAHNYEVGIFTFKKDTNLIIKELHDEFESLSDAKFREDWNTIFPDQNGYKCNFEIYYNNSFIKKFYAVGVDGGKCTLPIPITWDCPPYKISKFQHKFATIINSCENTAHNRLEPFNYFWYLNFAKIKVDENSESGSDII